MTAITVLTAQNTLGVRAIHGVPPEMLRKQIDAVLIGELAIAVLVRQLFHRAVLVTPNLDEAALLVDCKLESEQDMKSGPSHWMRTPRIHSTNTHGTGCTLSSAIAANLALGADLLEAVQAAHGFVRSALEASANVRTGAGCGPLNHGAAPKIMQRKDLR